MWLYSRHKVAKCLAPALGQTPSVSLGHTIRLDQHTDGEFPDAHVVHNTNTGHLTHDISCDLVRFAG